MNILYKFTGAIIQYRSQWRTFISASEDELQEQIEKTLSELGWPYQIQEKDLTSGEKVWFGSEQTTSFEVADVNITIAYFPVTYDPVSNIALTFTSTEDTIEQYEDSACLIDITPVTRENNTAITTFLQSLSVKLPSDPWDIEHPRFNTSPLLRYKVKILWKYWLEKPSS